MHEPLFNRTRPGLRTYCLWLFRRSGRQPLLGRSAPDRSAAGPLYAGRLRTPPSLQVVHLPGKAFAATAPLFKPSAERSGGSQLPGGPGGAGASPQSTCVSSPQPTTAWWSAPRSMGRRARAYPDRDPATSPRRFPERLAAQPQAHRRAGGTLTVRSSCASPPTASAIRPGRRASSLPLRQGLGHVLR